MRRTFIYLLLLANLVSGIAFAWDTHPEAVVGEHAGDMLSGLDSNRGEPTDDAPQGDHCAHGAAHLTGMFYDATTDISCSTSVRLRSPLFVATSRDVSPLLRPPSL